MTKKAILLAGLHKTGTTSIQSTFRQHARLLASQGFTYPLLELKVGEPDSIPENHSKLVLGMFARRIGQSTSTQNPYRRGLQDAFDSFLRSRRVTNLVIVAEAISTMAPEDLQDLKTWFEQRDFQVDLRCSVRHVQPWVESMIAQRVAGVRGPRLPLARAVAQFEESGGIVRPRLENLARVFPEARFSSFELATRQRQGPFGQFVASTGITGLELVEPVVANLGMSDHAVRLHSLINQAIGDRSRHLRTYASLPVSHPALYAVPGPKFRLRQEEAGRLRAMVVAENEWLRDRHGPDFASGRIAFEADRPKLDSGVRQFLQSNFAQAPPWLKAVVERYLNEAGEPTSA